jgi:hypothetical protein
MIGTAMYQYEYRMARIYSRLRRCGAQPQSLGPARPQQTVLLSRHRLIVFDVVGFFCGTILAYKISCRDLESSK